MTSVETIGRTAVDRRLGERGLNPRWRGTPPPSFADLALDSRAVESGDLFCAIPGTRVDGHDFVEAAAAAGAVAAVVERPLDAPVPQLLVRDGRAAAAHLASLFRGDPARRLRMVGVTGTNGKTTTVWLTRHLLQAELPTAALGTLGTLRPDGSREPGELTTPDPLALMERLRTLGDEGAEAVAMEVSSHALDQRRADGIRFDVAVFTNLSREHLDYHGAMGEYRASKLRLLELSAPGGTCIANADDPAWVELPAFTYGLSPKADLRAESVEPGPEGTRFRLTGRAGTAEVRLSLPGAFNVHNALAAAAVALDSGMDLAEVAARLSAAPAVPGRMEVLRREPSLVIRDYAHTPDSYRRVLETLRPLASGRLLVVFGAGGDRDPGKRPEMGRIAGELADLAIVTTDNPRTEDPAEIASQVVAEVDPDRYELVPDRRDAIARALRLSGPGDVVVLLGKGHETYQAIGDRKLPFDEAEIVAEFTAGGGA